MAEQQVQQTNPAADPAGSAPSGQGTQQVQGQVQTQQTGQEGQPAWSKSPEDWVHYEKRNFRHLSPTGNLNDVVGMANKYAELQRDGFVGTNADGSPRLVDWAKQAGVRGEQVFGFLQEALTKEPENRTPTEQAAVAGATGTQQNQLAKQVQAEAGAEGQYLTLKQAQELVRDEVTKARQEAITEGSAKAIGEVEARASRQRQEEAEKQAIQQALDSTKLFGKKVKVDWSGESQEIDLDARDAALSLYQQCQDIVDAHLRKTARPQDFARLRSEPFSPEIVKVAIGQLGPHWKQRFGGAADVDAPDPKINNSDLPPAGLHGGQGGRAQPAYTDIPPEKRAAHLLARVRQKQRAQT